MPQTAEELIQKVQAIEHDMATVKRRAKEQLDRLRKQRRALLLRANRAGATYDTLVEQCNISDGGLAREMRKAREEQPRYAPRPSSVPEYR